MHKSKEAFTFPSSELFLGKAKVETFLKDFDRLRQAIRSHDTFEIESAWEKCERWVSCINPNKSSDHL